MTEEIVDREGFVSRIHREIKKVLPDQRVGKDFTRKMIEYMFGDFEDKLLYAKKQAEGKGDKTLKAVHAEDIYSVKWISHMEKEGLVFPLEVFNKLTARQKEKLVKLFERKGVTLVFD